MKKLIALVLALAMVLTIGAAFAADDASTAKTETITVHNALIGESYVIYKMMGATVDGNGAISYKGTVPTELEDVLAVVEEEIPAGSGIKYNVLSKKSGVSDDTLFAALKDYCTTDTKVAEKNNITETPVVFDNLEPGYYVITSTAGNKYIVTSTTPSQKDVYEKNTIEIEVGKEAPNDHSIGDTIPYTVTFNGPNYRGTGSEARIVTKYTVTDTLPEFLEDVKVTSIKIGETTYTGNDLNNEKFPGVESFGTTKTFDIPWATKGTGDHDWTSKYPSNTEVEIKYTGKLTKVVKFDGTEDTGNKNEVDIQPVTDTPDGGEPWEEHHKADEEVFTYGAALIKVDNGTGEAQKKLAGAKFHFKGLTVTADPNYTKGVYVVTSYDASSTEYGTEVEVGDDGLLYILGLKSSVKLTGEETVAPAGYNKLATTFTLEPQVMSHTIWTSTEDKYFDKDGNLVAAQASATKTEKVTKNIEDLDEEALNIVNQVGTELPHTGGIGTTIFYILGGLLVIGAAVILVARRKAQD
jgi:LPXTG-motif cell wall-anchored protein